MTTLGFIVLFCGLLCGLNWLSYDLFKLRILNSRTWDLNVCCGRTDGGGINTDIVAHGNIPDFVIADPLSLPFKEKSFKSVVCSHAAEHIPDPEALMRELNRVGEEVTFIIPPLWDVAAACNLLEHRWFFISHRKVYLNELPKYKSLPMASSLQKIIGQRIRA
jgi:SAM-dependent methyltransferase